MARIRTAKTTRPTSDHVSYWAYLDDLGFVIVDKFRGWDDIIDARRDSSIQRLTGPFEARNISHATLMAEELLEV